jgi:hypothetical protein
VVNLVENFRVNTRQDNLFEAGNHRRLESQLTELHTMLKVKVVRTLSVGDHAPKEVNFARHAVSWVGWLLFHEFLPRQPIGNTVVLALNR